MDLIYCVCFVLFEALCRGQQCFSHHLGTATWVKPVLSNGDKVFAQGPHLLYNIL